MTNTYEKIKKIRDGDRPLCNRCSVGHIVPKGDASTTKVFACDNCGITLVLTVPLKSNTEDDR